MVWAGLRTAAARLSGGKALLHSRFLSALIGLVNRFKHEYRQDKTRNDGISRSAYWLRVHRSTAANLLVKPRVVQSNILKSDRQYRQLSERSDNAKIGLKKLTENVSCPRSAA